MVTGIDIVNAARQYLGSTWQHQARVRGNPKSESIIDCLGLVALTCEDCGIKVSDRTDYSRQPHPDFIRTVESCCTRTEELVPGVILTFRIRKLPQHIAIATDKGIIHSLVDDVAKELAFDDWWRERCTGMWRINGVEY